MSFNIQFLLVLLLSWNCRWNEAAANAEPRSEDAAIPQPVDQREPISLIDLNDDVLYIILEELDPASSLHILKVCSKLSTLMDRTVRNKYNNWLIHLHYSDTEIDHKVHPHKKHIEIYDDELGLSILKQFGSSIKRLMIDNNLEDRYPETLKYVNKYTSNSLTHLEITYITSGTLRIFKHPFTKVEHLKIRLNKNQSGKVHLFNETFPQLRELNVEFNGFYNFSYINCEFPHLTHLEMRVSSEVTWDRRDELEGLIRKNPQIKNFGIFGLPMSPNEYFPILNQLLPDMESFSVSWLYSGAPGVSFNNVKQLSMRSIIPDGVVCTFPSLRSIRMEFQEHHFDASQNFFQNHPHLTEMYIRTDFQPDTNHPRLVELLSEQINLIELNLVFQDEVDPNVIIEIADNQPNLMRFSFTTCKLYWREAIYDETKADIIYERLKNDWKITKIGYDDRHPGDQGLLMDKIQ